MPEADRKMAADFKSLWRRGDRKEWDRVKDSITDILGTDSITSRSLSSVYTLTRGGCFLLD